MQGLSTDYYAAANCQLARLVKDRFTKVIIGVPDSLDERGVFQYNFQQL
jgi:hypothetical protein